MSSITIRINEEDKIAAEQIFKALGLNISSATNAFFKQVIRTGGIPFSLKADFKADPFFSSQNQKRLKKSILQMQNEGGKIHEILK